LVTPSAGHSRAPAAVALLLAAFTLLCFSIWSGRNFVIPHHPFGEAEAAFLGAENLRIHGWRWAGLQDMSTSPDPADHPLLYIHHPNFGLYFSYALNRIGISAIETQNAASFVGTIAGLLLAYLFATRLFGSSLQGFVFCALLTANVDFILNWSFNIHRAFSYASVFGTMYAFMRFAEAGGKSAVWLLLFFVACLTLIGTDYMFFFWTAIALATYALLFQTRQSLAALFWIAAVFGTVFALRQVQVMAGIGPSEWASDFLFQILNRLHLDHLYPADWLPRTQDFYQRNRIMNPGFSGHMTLVERAYTLVVGTGEAMLRALGIAEPHKRLSLATGSLFAVLVAGAIVVERVKHGRLSQAAKAAFVFFVPCIVMALIFPAYFPNWYRVFLLGHICIAGWLTATVVMLASLRMKEVARPA